MGLQATFEPLGAKGLLAAGRASPPRRTGVPEGDSEVTRLLRLMGVLLWVSGGCCGHRGWEVGGGSGLGGACALLCSDALMQEVCGGPGGDQGEELPPRPRSGQRWHLESASGCPSAHQSLSFMP